MDSVLQFRTKPSQSLFTASQTQMRKISDAYYSNPCKSSRQWDNLTKISNEKSTKNQSLHSNILLGIFSAA